MTGDVVDSSHTNYKRALGFLGEAKKIAPVYYITGNHEKWLEEEKTDDINGFYEDIRNIGVNFIDNQAINIDDKFYLIGLSDDELDSNMLKEISEDIPYDTFKVLLAHEPAYYENYSTCGMDLVITGHVHGGQFIVPGKGGFVSPEFEFFPELYEGLHTYKDTAMIISRGLGNSVIPLRINNYPELVVIKLAK